jgi:hypothetical protein
MALSPRDFEQRLRDISKYQGIVYGRVFELMDAETEYGTQCVQFKGYLALSDAFKSLGIETLGELLNEIRPLVKKPLSDSYAIFLPRLVHSFQTMCGAERVALRGYPLHGYTLLRNTFDNLVLTSAALQKHTDFYSIEGLEPGKPFDPNTFGTLRKKTEWKVREVMTGAKSGLSQKTIDKLRKWDALFDYETHGARLSLATAMGWMKGIEPLAVLPAFHKDNFALFMNRYCEVAWMAHRLVPAVQPPEVPFSSDWKKRWGIIDESFELLVHSLTAELGKDIGQVMVDLVKTKFPFTADAVFPL